MKNKPIAVTELGVYFFPSPAQVSLRVTRELLVVLNAPMTHACGFVLFDTTHPLRELEEALDRLTLKMCFELKIESSQIQAKIFGMPFYRESVASGVARWLESNKIRLAVRDIGRNARREILIDCDQGRVGVQYSSTAPTGAPEFMSVGSARTRFQTQAPVCEVLILSTNPVKRLLAQQAVEEIQGVVATAPADANGYLNVKDWPSFPFSHVFILEDLAENALLKSFLKAMASRWSAVNLVWVGETVPAFAKDYQSLSTPHPETISTFKEQVAPILLNDEETSATSRLLSFGKPKTKKLG